MIERVKRLMWKLMHGGTSTFHPKERVLLDAVIESLPEAESKVFREQINAVDLVQRHNKGASSFGYYFDPQIVPQLAYEGLEYCLASVSYTQEKKRTVKVFLHDGRLQSLEGRMPLDNAGCFEVNSVNLHPKNKRSPTERLGRHEHGE